MTQTTAQVAIVGDYDNEWDGELDSWHGPYMRQSVQAWFTALQYQHIPVDAVYLRPTTTLDDLAAYRVLVYPHPAIMIDATAALLSEYVRQGDGCIRERADGTEQLIFLLNYSDGQQTVTVHKAATDAISGQRVHGAAVLAPFDLRILSTAGTGSAAKP